MNESAANQIKRQAEGLAEAVKNALASDPRVTEPLWTRQRAADYLGLSLRSVDRLVVAGELRRVRIGARAVRFIGDEVRQFVNDGHRNQPAAASAAKNHDQQKEGSHD